MIWSGAQSRIRLIQGKRDEMLDVMRRANRQKWFLIVVVTFVVLAFVFSVFAIWVRCCREGATRRNG